VPDRVLSGQLKAYPAARSALDTEGFDQVIDVTDDDDRADRSPVAGSVELVPAPHYDAPAAAARQQESPVALEFGLHIPTFDWPGGPEEIGPRLAAVARAAEAVGFRSIWVMDHFLQIPQFGRAWDPMLESWTTVGYLAGATEQARLGVLVTGITYRNLAHVAKIVATVDVLSGGRAWCGLGAGWYDREHRAYGWRFPPVRERYELLEDALRLLPVMWGPGTPRFEGRTITVEEAACYPRPIQDRIPIVVGGSGERRTLALVARYADGCNLFGDPATVRRKVDVLHRHCAAADRDPTAVAVTHLSTALAGSDRAALDALVERLRPNRASVESFMAAVNGATVADHIGRFRALADAGVGTAIVSLPDVADPDSLDRFAPVIAAFSP
jgi:F420-dependent oxidoreductase-like protein